MYHWVVGQIAFFLCEFSKLPQHPQEARAKSLPVAAGIQMGNTVITSYIVDCYPLQSMSVITFYSVFLNLSAFINPVGSLAPPPDLRLYFSQFFIAPWQASSGWTWTFAAQGIITFFASVPVLAAIHKFGPRLRAKSGQPFWVNPEYDTL